MTYELLHFYLYCTFALVGSADAVVHLPEAALSNAGDYFVVGEYGLGLLFGLLGWLLVEVHYICIYQE